MGPTGERTLWFRVQHADPVADDDVWLTEAELQEAAPALYFDWKRDHDPLAVPVAILGQRVDPDPELEGQILEYRVLYNDGAQFWLREDLLIHRAYSLVCEWLGMKDPVAVPAEGVSPAAPLMRVRAMCLCAARWCDHQG